MSKKILIVDDSESIRDVYFTHWKNPDMMSLLALTVRMP